MPSRSISLPGQFVAAIAVPPTLPSQAGVSVSVSNANVALGQFRQEGSTLHRPILQIESLAVPSLSPTLYVTYKATIIRRKLVRGAPASPPALLTDLERLETLSPTALCDFSKPGFQQWLTDQQLRKAAGENDIDFGYRAFSYIKKNYIYYHDAASGSSQHTADYLRAQHKADCGELVELYAAIMRGNGVPFRIKVGHNLDETDISHAYGCHQHVRGEFYASGVGWVPTEITGALGLADDEYVFGYDNRWFLTNHVDTGLRLDTKYWGVRTVDWAAVVRYWSSVTPSSDPSEDWQVTEASPQATL